MFTYHLLQLLSLGTKTLSTGTKKLLEETIKGMELNNYLFFRFGKINTSMSLNHRSSFFDLEVNQAAKVLSKSLFKKVE